MKIDKSRIVEEAVSNFSLGYDVQHAYLRGDRLEATDGRILVSIPIERHKGDVDGFIPVEAIKQARESKQRGTDKLTITAGKKDIVFKCKRPTGGAFPDTDAIIKAEHKEVFKIRINPWLLVKLARAIGCSGSDPSSCAVVLSFSAEDKPVKVTRHEDPAVLGFLMPAVLR